MIAPIKNGYSVVIEPSVANVIFLSAISSPSTDNFVLVTSCVTEFSFISIGFGFGRLPRTLFRNLDMLIILSMKQYYFEITVSIA